MKHKILIIIGSIIVIGLVIFLITCYAMPTYETSYDIKEIKSIKLSESLYIKKKVWGITDDNQLIVISKSHRKDFTTDSTVDYIYSGLSDFFYKFSQDTLYIYSIEKSVIPSKLKSQIKIVQVELKNPEMMDLIKDESYKNKGLIKF